MPIQTMTNRHNTFNTSIATEFQHNFQLSTRVRSTKCLCPNYGGSIKIKMYRPSGTHKRTTHFKFILWKLYRGINCLIAWNYYFIYTAINGLISSLSHIPWMNMVQCKNPLILSEWNPYCFVSQSGNVEMCTSERCVAQYEPSPLSH